MTFKKLISITALLFFVSSCGMYKKVDARKIPTDGRERALKNIAEGRGASIGNFRKAIKQGGAQYEFSTSNPMWRASLDVLDFMPLSTIDYSGGMIISDWYQDKNDNKNSLKITKPNRAESTTTETFTMAKILEFVNSRPSYDLSNRNIEKKFGIPRMTPAITFLNLILIDLKST